MFNKECEWTKEQICAEAARLKDQMTIKEKAMLVSGNWHMLRDSVVYKRAYNPVPVDSHGCKRLHIAPIRFTDGPRGVVMGNSTCFPVSMARAASFDRSLERRIGEAIGEEARAGGANYYGGVCINLLMHPAGGRAQESYGEDPYLVGEMGASLVQGVQTHNVMACVKHYALNNMENRRFTVDVDCDERTLREVYLPHFKKCVDAGAASLMGSYNLFRGDHASESRYLLRKVLREDWGFEGFVITDFIFALRDCVKAMQAGMDMEMPIPVQYGLQLKDAVESGQLEERYLDEAVMHLLQTQLTFEHCKDPRSSYDKSLICSKAHTELAREAAEQGMVLLKNNEVLPFARTVRKVLVAGHLAAAENTGDHGSSRVYAPYVITVVDGIRRYLGEDAQIEYCTEDELDKAAALAPDMDAVIIVAGNDYNDEGECVMPSDSINPIEYMAQGFKNNGHRLMGKMMERAAGKSDAVMQSYTSSDGGAVGGDRKSLSLRPAEIALINRIAPLNRNTVVTLVCGSMIMTKEWDASAPAILYSWYSGMEGGNALARVLFGDVNPSGHLPFVIPTDEAHLPQVDFNSDKVHYGYFHGYQMLEHDGHAPAYAFGYGLSYTTFAYGEPAAAVADDGIHVTQSVTNTGAVRGAAVVQVYDSMPASRVLRHNKDLCGFDKVTLEPGETQQVEIVVPYSELEYYDEQSGAFVLENGSYRFLAGCSSRDQDLQAVEVSIQR